jgi:hypothetical protein
VGVAGAALGLLAIGLGDTGARAAGFGSAFALPIALGAAGLVAGGWLIGALTAHGLRAARWRSLLWRGPVAGVECWLIGTAALMLGSLIQLGLVLVCDQEQLPALAGWMRLWADASGATAAVAAGIGLAGAAAMRALPSR